jgi:HD-GYP domain-containing protein (c-di-GMP phosphodiesterase class II)
VIPIVFHHHERYDGGGYADGLSGDGIPLGARILSVADAYVAMTSGRPYRLAFSAEQALQEVISGSGTQFDPKVVDALVELVSSNADCLALPAS